MIREYGSGGLAGRLSCALSHPVQSDDALTTSGADCRTPRCQQSRWWHRLLSSWSGAALIERTWDQCFISSLLCLSHTTNMIWQFNCVVYKHQTFRCHWCLCVAPCGTVLMPCSYRNTKVSVSNDLEHNGSVSFVSRYLTRNLTRNCTNSSSHFRSQQLDAALGFCVPFSLLLQSIFKDKRHMYLRV